MSFPFKTDTNPCLKTHINIDYDGLSVNKFIEISSNHIIDKYYRDTNGNLKIFFYTHIRNQTNKIYIQENEELFTTVYPDYKNIGFYFEFFESPCQSDEESN